ncbi:Hypothetical predicted protein [Octopus vulgaris]|uniref:Uncharacterized protein n=1 Tax=Octopus vulgaris TaxID=6645 RepID=A0AA36FHJ6_OCTVU|nr:Hypothetical predicted protein [Octopus vulgaris]
MSGTTEQENRYRQRKPTPLQIDPAAQHDAVKVKDKDFSNCQPLSEALDMPPSSNEPSLPPSPATRKSPFTFEFPVEAAK